jgi:hypothetical protein
MVEWRPIIIGTVLTITSYIILSYAQQGGINAAITFLLGGVLVGFIIKPKIGYIDKIKDFVAYGLILGVVSSVISIIILLIQMYYVGLSTLFDATIIVPLLILFVSDVVASLAGVIIGIFSREEYTKSLTK